MDKQKVKPSYEILNQRRAIKQSAGKTLRSHFLLLVFLCLIMIFFGTEFRQAANGISGYAGAGPFKNYAASRLGGVSGLSDITNGELPLTAGDIFAYFSSGQFVKGITASEELENRIKERVKARASENDFFGRSRGELAKLVNTLNSGKIFSMLAQTILAVTHSDKAVSIIFMIGGFLWYSLLFLLLRNVYSAAVRRPFLEARVYSRVSYLELLYFVSVKKWLKACRTMALQYLYYTLWSLTIVGAFVKYFSYFAVPYIVAENPDVKARDAILLSRRMMDGHKMELFLFHLTLLGWQLLSILTVGFSDMFYGAAYRMCCYTEFYVKVREEAIQKELPGIEALNDPLLYEKAGRITLFETYFDVVDELTLLNEQKVTLFPAQEKVSRWFGIWIGSLRLKKQYDDLEARKYAIRAAKFSMEGLSYPHRLNPLKKNEPGRKARHFFFMRSYSVWTLVLLFLAFCFAGWCWEVVLHYIQTGKFANRGVLHGPWLPIYGSGGILVLLILSRLRKNPVAEFFTAIALCGGIEYFAGWFLETRYHERWWSYDGYFLNLHGRVCAEGLLVFGIASCLIVYLIAPLIDYLLAGIRPGILIGISAVLAALFMADTVYSHFYPNRAKGAVERRRPEKDSGSSGAEKPVT